MAIGLSIIIGGDTVPTASNKACLMNGQAGAVFNGVKEVFSSTDWTIVNLECPLTKQNAHIKKAGPCLKAEPGTIHGLVAAGVKVFSLANNHIMDFGTNGLKDTLKQINEKGALYSGAGEDLLAARKILYLQKESIKVALISVAEHEFSIAEEDSPGANPFDPFDTMDDIREASRAAELVIVLYHGGIEHYPFPSPNLQRVCRKMVDNGANYVICQHSHCIGSYERYRDGHIVYGQGNLLFDYLEDELWQTGLLVEITIENAVDSINFIPIVRRGGKVDVADATEKEEILSSFYERSQHIKDEQYVQKEWLKFARSKEYHYLQRLLGFGKLLRQVDNKLNNFLVRCLFKKKNYIALYAFLNCEAHLDIVKNFLREEYENGES